MMWRSWAHPRSLLVLARACERAGDAACARDAADRLLRELFTADPGLPLVVEARALRARLRPPPR
jgi:hypothetical protein